MPRSTGRLTFWDRLAICIAIAPLACLLPDARADGPGPDKIPYKVSCPGQTGTEKCPHWYDEYNEEDHGKAVCLTKKYKYVATDYFTCGTPLPGMIDCSCWQVFEGNEAVMHQCLAIYDCVWTANTCQQGPLSAGEFNPTTAPVYWGECATAGDV